MTLYKSIYLLVYLLSTLLLVYNCAAIWRMYLHLQMLPNLSAVLVSICLTQLATEQTLNICIL